MIDTGIEYYVKGLWTLSSGTGSWRSPIGYRLLAVTIIGLLARAPRGILPRGRCGLFRDVRAGP